MHDNGESQMELRTRQRETFTCDKMSIALLIFCVLPMASRGNLYAQSPNGALQASGKTSVTGAPPARMGDAPGSPGPDPAGPPAGSPGATFAEEGLQAHNYYRSFHDSPPMTLNEQMNNQAIAYANKLTQDEEERLRHSPEGEREGQGENLYMGCSSRPGDMAGSFAVKAWYDEVCSPGYPFGSVQSPGSAGHFTQVVWSDSTELGYGKATVDRRGMKCTFVVARYKPRGNFFTGHDDYNKNVKKGSNFDKDNYCRGRKRKRNQFRAKSVFPAERVMLGLPEESTHEQGVLRKGKISQKIANTGFTAYQ